jgi:copper(I)-binding protein
MLKYLRGCSGPLMRATIATLGLAVSQSIALAHNLTAADTMVIAQAQIDHSGRAPNQTSISGNDTYKVGDLVVMSPWSRATPGGAKIGGGYFQIKNNGASTDRLVGTTVSFADHVEIHEMSMSNGVMKMRPLTNGLEIKPGETIELKPGGFHMMFMDLKQPLKEGDLLKATLTFEKAGPLEVNFSVNSMGASSSSHRQ